MAQPYIEDVLALVSLVRVRTVAGRQFANVYIIYIAGRPGHLNVFFGAFLGAASLSLQDVEALRQGPLVNVMPRARRGRTKPAKALLSGLRVGICFLFLLRRRRCVRGRRRRRIGAQLPFSARAHALSTCDVDWVPVRRSSRKCMRHLWFTAKYVRGPLNKQLMHKISQ